MEKECISGAEKVRNAAAAIIEIFENGGFSFGEASATIRLCLSFLLIDAQHQYPQIISQEPKMIESFVNKLKDTIAIVRKEYTEEDQK